MCATSLALAAGCPVPPDEPAPPTWQDDIRPLFARSCVPCHTPGGQAPFPLTTYDEVAAFGPVVRSVVLERSMPPWGHDEDCRPALGSLWLSDEDVALVDAWGAADFPPGDNPVPAEAAPFAPVARPDPDRVLTFSAPYPLDPQKRDDYRCIVLDEPFVEDTYVTLTDFFPDNTAVVHHVIVYVVGAQQVAALEALDEADPGLGYTCFGDSGIPEANWLAGWAPGQGAGFPSADTAVRLPAGSRIVMQMHYNVVAAGPEDDLTDQTQIALWTLPPGQTPDYLITTLPVPNYGIDIPAGEAASVHHSSHRLPLSTTIVGAAPHMHLLGQSLRMDLVREDGGRECLVDVPHWDFDWQRGYLYPLPSQLSASVADRFEMTCTFDNSVDNQPRVGGEVRPPEAVGWGEGSLDEMCLMTLVLREPFFPAAGTGVCAGFSSCMTGCAAGDAFCPFACMTKLGLGCLQCGSDAIFGPCTREQCPVETVDFGACFYQCPVDDEDPYAAFSCMADRCRGPLEALYACAEPRLRDGTCADDWAACGGVSP